MSSLTFQISCIHIFYASSFLFVLSESGLNRTNYSFCRYVISNACSKEICYKQKGTNFFHRLGIGQHSHLHWADTTRWVLAGFISLLFILQAALVLKLYKYELLFSPLKIESLELLFIPPDFTFST